jgi:hypothetical protein
LGNTLRLPHAAGIIGISGGIGRKMDALPVHTLKETGGVGVYAQGSDATEIMVPPTDENGSTITGPNVPSGPEFPGPGVLGRGGVTNVPRAQVAAGVIGVAGNIPIPASSETQNTGVYGHGGAGIRGRGEGGPGVHGISDSDRGGTFQSARSAQVLLLPLKAPGVFPTAIPVSPSAIPIGREGGMRLPKDGRGGDLLALVDDNSDCALWFCVKTGRSNGGPSAEWAPVLLGPRVTGTG